MAEFVGIAGGMAAVLQLAGTGRHFFNTLYRFARNAGAAGAEVERFANQVQSFSNTVELAEQILSSYCREHPKSRLVTFLNEREVLGNIDKEAEAVLDHLEAIHAQVNRMETRSVLWASIKWSIKKSSILELSPEMDSVKTSLNLVMATAQFENMTLSIEAGIKSGSEESNKELKKQMRGLRRVIKHHLETMQDLRTQLGHMSKDEREAIFDELNLDSTGKDPLTELGWIIYDSGTIPDPLDTSPSRSLRSHSNRSRKTRGTPPKRRRSTTPHPVRSALPSGQTFPEPPPSTCPALSSQSFPKPLSLNHKTLRYRQEDVISVTSGYVKNIRGVLRWHKTGASLVESLDRNLISINRARELNLDVEPASSAEDILFDFGTGKLEKSFGKTTFKWKPLDYLDPRHPPLTITCDVCENSTVDLVLGKPFREEVERRWPEDKRSVLYPLR